MLVEHDIPADRSSFSNSGTTSPPGRPSIAAGEPAPPPGEPFDDYLFRGAFGPFGPLFPLPRPARTIVALVMLTASRSAVSAMWA